VTLSTVRDRCGAIMFGAMDAPENHLPTIHGYAGEQHPYFISGLRA
jgi:hypothetical protein